MKPKTTGIMLLGDGCVNQWAIIGRARKALKHSDKPHLVSEFTKEAVNGDLAHTVKVCHEFLTVFYKKAGRDESRKY